MLDAVTATAGKMAGAAVFACRAADALGDLVPFRREVFFIVALEYGGLFSWVACTGRKFFVCSSLFVTDQAIYFALVGEVEVLAFPSIACVTRCATSLVAFYVHSEVIDRQTPFSKLGAFLRIGIHPGPVDGLVKLERGLVVAGQAGLGNFRPGCKFLFQDFVL